MGERGVKDFSMPLSDLGKPDEDFPGDHADDLPGLVKWTVQEPAGEHHFSFLHGDHAEVHFTGKLLDGTVFASSRENGIPLLLPRLYFQDGFGEQGRPAKGNEAAVPPDATLYVNPQLMSSVSHVGVNRDIIKKFITIPRRYNVNQPYNEAVVKVRLIGKLQDGTVFDRRGHDEEEPLKFTIDEEHVIYGLDEAVMTMREGEVASFTIPPQHAFGVAGSNQYHLDIVPPNSVVIYEMELLSVVEDEPEHKYTRPQTITSEEFIEAAKIKERDGDDLFSSRKYLRAYRRYLRARQILPPCFKYSFDEMELPDCHQIKEMLISTTLKSAKCAILLQCYEEASKRYHEVLKYDPGNAKALGMMAQPWPKSPVEIDSDALNRGLEFYEAVLHRCVAQSASRELPYRPPPSRRPIIVPGLPPATPVSPPKASQQPPVSTPPALPQSPANQSSLAQRFASLLICSRSGFSSPRYNSSHGPGP